MSSERTPVQALTDLHRSYMEGRLDRRALLTRAATLGLTASALSVYTRGIMASAQEATPVTAVLPGGFKSMTREEYKARLSAEYPFITAERPQGGTVILGDTSSSSMTTTNPMFAQNFPTQDLLFTVFDQLANLYPTGGADYVPALADWFEIAEDGVTYTFHLNPNATFHDGTPLTAADVAFSCDAVANPDTGTQYQASFVQTIASYRAVDDHTFETVATSVMPQIVFFGNFFCPVIPKHLWESVPVADWQSDPGSTGQDPSRVIGSGPFKFESLNESEGTASFTRYDGYYDDVAAIEKYIFQTWPDSTAIVEALRGDQLDVYVENVPPSDVEGLQAEENIDVQLLDTYKFAFFGYNLLPDKTPLFQQKEVRQALIYAIDRQSIIDNIMLGFAVLAVGTQPVLSEAYAPEEVTTVYNYDPTKAAQLLDAAGWAVGGDGTREKDGTKLSFEMLYGSGDATQDSIAAAFQDFWKAVGVDGRPSAVDFDTVIVPAATENFDFQVMMLTLDWATPSGDQSAMFGTEFHGAGLNLMGYSNPTYDDLNSQANTLDRDKRRALLIQASDVVNEEAPAGILWFTKDRIAYNVRLQNFVPTVNSLLWTLHYVVVSE